MKKASLLILLILSLSSCTQVLFMQPVPIEVAALESIPNELKGVFKVKKEKDTLFILDREIRLGQEKPMKMNGSENGDFILKPYKKGYVANILEDSVYQLIYLLPKGKKTLLLYLPDIDDDKKLAVYAKMASKIIPKEGTKEPEKYFVQPGPGIMDEIMSKKLLTKPTKMKRIKN